ncbi:MAG TPA: type III-A CRISPR-associated protein Csm2 [Bryobacteraceae bacterium]|jgi:CRISPR type III-A-associated protein Csm2|nr:type III-A CRISPR-associated protein Csm2 [Bryobacteraceae bacterium]
MADEEVQQEATAVVEKEPAQKEPPPREPPKTEPPPPEPPRTEPPKQEQKRREDRPPRPPGEQRNERRPERPGGERRDDRRDDRRGGDRGEKREGGRPGGRPFEGPPEIELEKLISDSLYLDNQAHAIVARMRDMDSGTKSQLRRLYNAVRRAVRAPENEKQHQFVMLRARLAYTIARHSLRSLDALERLLLQVTRRNDAKGYERFKDLFEAIVAYNE